MKIAVVCASGKAGRLVVKGAVSRGHDVTAFARSDNQTVSQFFVKKDLFALAAADLKGFDAVVDAFGAWLEQDQHLHSDSLKHLCKVLAGSDTRLYVVGGAGSLFINKEHSAQVSDSPEFPAMFLPLAKA